MSHLHNKNLPRPVPPSNTTVISGVIKSGRTKPPYNKPLPKNNRIITKVLNPVKNTPPYKNPLPKSDKAVITKVLNPVKNTPPAKKAILPKRASRHPVPPSVAYRTKPKSGMQLPANPTPSRCATPARCAKNTPVCLNAPSFAMTGVFDNLAKNTPADLGVSPSTRGAAGDPMEEKTRMCLVVYVHDPPYGFIRLTTMECVLKESGGTSSRITQIAGDDTAGEFAVHKGHHTVIANVVDTTFTVTAVHITYDTSTAPPMCPSVDKLNAFCSAKFNSIHKRVLTPTII